MSRSNMAYRQRERPAVASECGIRLASKANESLPGESGIRRYWDMRSRD